MHSNRYTIFFALAVCVTCSVILALTAGGLKPVIQRNVEFDIHRNILKGLDFEITQLTREDLESLYSERIREFAVDDSGKVVMKGLDSGFDPSSPEIEVELPVFARVDEGQVTGYCIPISGKGLWSTLYGYLALQSDGETVMGITFYKHGETPGLGGEVEAAWFTDNFKGKKIFNSNGELTSITIWKGVVPDDMPQQKQVHVVDGISGATMTGSGVNIFLKSELERYESFFQAIRRGEKPAIQGV